MKINVKRLPEEGEELVGSEPASIMELEDPEVRFEQEIRYALTAQIRSNALIVTGRLEAPVTLRCGRCLRRFARRLRVNDFVFHQELHGEDFIDLTPQLREDIILELPQRALCDESCKGLCPVCGTDLNQTVCQCRATPAEPRWQALDQLNIK